MSNKNRGVSVDLTEFMQMMKEAMSQDDWKRQELFKGFSSFDNDGIVKISFKNLKRVAGELGEIENSSDDQLRDLITEVSRGGAQPRPLCPALWHFPVPRCTCIYFIFVYGPLCCICLCPLFSS